jgi:hypothetical protein
MVVRGGQNRDFCLLDEFTVGFLHIAIHCHENPIVLGAKLYYPGVFYALLYASGLAIWEMCAEPLNLDIASRSQPFSMGFGEYILKKQDARLSVFFDQGG